MRETTNNTQRETREFSYNGEKILLEDNILNPEQDEIMNHVLRAVRHTVNVEDNDELNKGRHVYVLKNISLNNTTPSNERYLVLEYTNKAIRDQDRDTFIKSPLVSTNTVQMPQSCLKFTDLGVHHYIVLSTDKIVEGADQDKTTYKGVIIDPVAYKTIHIDNIRNNTVEETNEGLLEISREKLDSTTGVEDDERLDILTPMQIALKGNPSEGLASLPDTTIDKILEDLEPRISNRFFARIEDLMDAYEDGDPNIIAGKKREIRMYLLQEQPEFIDNIKKAQSVMGKTDDKEQREDLAGRLKIFYALIEKKVK